MGKPTICIGENKGADQLRGNREADQHLCFRYSDSTIPPLLNSKISSFWPASVAVQPSLCQTCSETTLLVFPRDGLFRYKLYHQDNKSVKCKPPHIPLLYSKTGFYRGIPILLLFAPKHKLWVLVRTASVRRF